MAKFLNNTGLARLVALIKQALGGKADKTELPLLVTYDGRSADYTYAEIKAAFDAGRIVEVKYNTSSGIKVGRYRLVSSTLGVFIFTEVGGVDREMGKLTLSKATGWSYTSTDLQDELVSGANIKTINNTSLLGSGNVYLCPYAEYADETALRADTTQRNGTIGFENVTHKFFIYHSPFSEWLQVAQGQTSTHTSFEYMFDIVFTH